MMAEKQEHNEDFKLSEEVGNVLAGDKSFSELTDPIVPDLLQFKRETNEKLNGQLPPSGQTWQRIQAEMEARPSSSVSIFYLNKTVFAAAAAVLIICFTGFYYYLSQPRLVGQSEETITEITLDDGSQITLRPYSKIFKTGRWSTVDYAYELTGEGFFVIEPQETEEFSVKAGNGIVRVMGTSFNLSSWSGKTQVYLEKGKVQIESENNNNKMLLQPGETASLSGHEIEKFTPENSKEYTDWMQHEIVFNNRTVAYLFSELEQHFQINITASEEVLNSRLSGQLPLDDLDQTLRDLEIVLNGTFTKTDDRSYNFKSN